MNIMNIATNRTGQESNGLERQEGPWKLLRSLTSLVAASLVTTGLVTLPNDLPAQASESPKIEPSNVLLTQEPNQPNILRHTCKIVLDTSKLQIQKCIGEDPDLPLTGTIRMEANPDGTVNIKFKWEFPESPHLTGQVFVDIGIINTNTGETLAKRHISLNKGDNFIVGVLKNVPNSPDIDLITVITFIKYNLPMTKYSFPNIQANNPDAKTPLPSEKTDFQLPEQANSPK